MRQNKSVNVGKTETAEVNGKRAGFRIKGMVIVYQLQDIQLNNTIFIPAIKESGRLPR